MAERTRGFRIRGGQVVLACVLAGLAAGLPAPTKACGLDDVRLRFLGFDAQSDAAYFLQEIQAAYSHEIESDWDGHYQVLAVLPNGAREFSARYLASDRFIDFRTVLRGMTAAACAGRFSWSCIKFKVTGHDDKTETDVAEVERGFGIKSPDQLADGLGALWRKEKIPARLAPFLTAEPSPSLPTPSCRLRVTQKAHAPDPEDGIIAFEYELWLEGLPNAPRVSVFEKKGESCAAPEVGDPVAFLEPERGWAVAVLPLSENSCTGGGFARRDMVVPFEPAACR